MELDRVGERVSIPHTGHHCQTSLLCNPAMMSSSHHMHCLSPRTQVVNTRRHLNSPTCPCACIAHTHTHKHTFTQSHSRKCTHKHTRYATYKHTGSVSRDFWHCCLESPPLFRERPGLSQASQCLLVQTAGLGWFTWALVSESTLCQRVCLVILPKLLTRVVRKGSVARQVRIQCG